MTSIDIIRFFETENPAFLKAFIYADDVTRHEVDAAIGEKAVWHRLREHVLSLKSQKAAPMQAILEAQTCVDAVVNALYDLEMQTKSENQP